MIDREIVSKVAKLACLRIDDVGIDAMAHDLGKITSYIDQLGNVNIDDVDLNDEVTVAGNPWREDNVYPSARPETLMSNAPASEAGYIKVPKVIADGEGSAE